MAILGYVTELQALENLNEARKDFEKRMEAQVTMVFPDPAYEAALEKFLLLVQENRS